MAFKQRLIARHIVFVCVFLFTVFTFHTSFGTEPSVSKASFSTNNWSPNLAGSVLIESATVIGLSPAVVQTGTGVKVGLVSPGVIGWQNSLNSGDLPTSFLIDNVTSFNTSTLNSAEGTAMMEIIHDIAPEAQLFCAVVDAFVTEELYKKAIDWLIDDMGVDLIVSDTLLSVLDNHEVGEYPYEGRSSLSQYVSEVIENRDIPFIVSSGNRATGHYAGVFDADANGYHQFAAGVNSVTVTVKPNVTIFVTMTWKEKFGEAIHNFTLEVIDPNNNSSLTRNTAGNPLTISSPLTNSTANDQNFRIKIQYNDLDLREAPEIDFEFYVLSSPDYFEFERPVLESSLLMPADATGAIVVGAATGVPSIHLADYRVQDYSSRGPTNDDRLNLDVIAPHGVSTTNSTYSPFYGTSAAAPHVAGVVALMLEAVPSLTAAEVTRALHQSARPFDGYGYPDTPNENVGHGLIYIPYAIEEALAIEEYRVDEGPGLNLDFNPRETTYIRSPRDISIDDIRILSETSQGDGTTLVEFTADITNTDTGIYSSVSVQLEQNLPIDVDYVDGFLQFQNIDELASVNATPDDKLSYLVNNEDLPEFKEKVLSGEWLTTTAFEAIIYDAPVRYIDEETDIAFIDLSTDANHDILIFSNTTELLLSLKPGEVLVADPNLNGYKPQVLTEADQFFRYYLGDLIPFIYESQEEDNGRILVKGRVAELYEILKSGSFEQDADEQYVNGKPFVPSLGDTLTAEEAEERYLDCLFDQEQNPHNLPNAALCGMKVIPIRFNGVEITDKLRLSGEVLFRSSGLKFRISVRNFELKEVSVSVDAGIDGTLLLESTGEVDNITLNPFGDNEQRILNVPLPGVTFNIAGVPVHVALALKTYVGASAQVPAGITLPLQSSVTVGMNMGWNKDDDFFYEPSTEIIPLQISDPTVLDALDASARIWTRTDLELTVNESVGTVMGVELFGEFILDPLANPWWSLNTGMDMTGRLNLSLLGLDLFDAGLTLHQEELFAIDAGGSLLDEFRNTTNGFSPMQESVSIPSGNDLRWVITSKIEDKFGSFTNGFIAPLPPYGPEGDGDYFIGADSATSGSIIARFSEEGEVIWMKTLGPGTKPYFGVPEEDGSMIVVGRRGLDIWIAKYNGDGNRLWVQSYISPNPFTLTGLTRGEDASGRAEYYVAGHIHFGHVWTSDPVVIKLDENGHLLWSKSYSMEGDDEFLGISATADGNMVLVGRTNYAFAPFPNQIPDVTINGLIAKINPNGDLLWANAVASKWGLQFNDVTEIGDGSLYFCGQLLGVINDGYPAMMVGMTDKNGKLIDHVLIGENPDDETIPGSTGDTAYDVAWKIKPIENGVLVVGSTGLSQDKAAWVAALNYNLAVRWFSVLDGPLEDQFLDVDANDDSFVAFGLTRSVLPIGEGGDSTTLLAKYPLEGMVRIDPMYGFETNYVQPRVYGSSREFDFDTASGRFLAVPFGSANLELSPGGEIPDSEVDQYEIVRLEDRTIDDTEVEDFMVH